MTKQSPFDYEFVKRWCRRGRIKQLAGEFGIPVKSAYSICNGVWRNPDFEQLLMNDAIKEANKWTAIEERKNAILKPLSV